jgi:HKD family nuclease
MRVSFVSHGLTLEGNSVGKTVLESFADATFTKFSCLVAFASESGVGGLSDAINASKTHINQFNVIVGIDQKATSKESLELLLSLDINTKVYYTASSIIFHPKIYVFDSPSKCRIIIGSSNLTQAGLFQNVEASLVVDFDKPDREGQAVLSQINTYFRTLFNGRAKNIKPLSSDLIRQLFESRTIPDRAENEEIRKGREIVSERRASSEAVNRVKNLFPSIDIQRLPTGFRRRARVIRTTTTRTPSRATGVRGVMLWEKELSASDAQQPPRPRTNPTGKLSLSQGNMEGIDQTKYFRETIFGNFTWTLIRAPSTESTDVLFRVRVLGVDKGEWRLKLRHNPNLEANQDNFTTSISWGDLGSIIKAQDLTGCILRLYAPAEGTTEPFFMDIG